MLEMTEAAQKRCFRPGECWVVIPARNEERRIELVVRSVRATGARVVVVDDGSSDATAEEARAAGAVVLRHAVNRGQGAALETGFTWIRPFSPRCTVTFDADGQHDPADLERLAGPILRGEADVVLGSRFLGEARGISRHRRWMLRAAVLGTRVMNGMRVTDTHNGVRAFSRVSLDRISLRQDGMAHASEILDLVAATGLRWIEVPVTIRYTEETRRKGQSTAAAIRILFDYLIGRWIR